MRLLNDKQGLRRSQFAQEGVDLEKILIVPIDAAKVLQKSMILNYFGEVIESPKQYKKRVGKFFFLPIPLE